MDNSSPEAQCSPALQKARESFKIALGKMEAAIKQDLAIHHANMNVKDNREYLPRTVHPKFPSSTIYIQGMKCYLNRALSDNKSDDKLKPLVSAMKNIMWSDTCVNPAKNTKENEYKNKTIRKRKNKRSNDKIKYKEYDEHVDVENYEEELIIPEPEDDFGMLVYSEYDSELNETVEIKNNNEYITFDEQDLKETDYDYEEIWDLNNPNKFSWMC